MSAIGSTSLIKLEIKIYSILQLEIMLSTNGKAREVCSGTGTNDDPGLYYLELKVTDNLY